MSKTNSYKLVLLGESAVGKSSLVLRFVRDEFSDFRESTIGAAFLTKTIELPASADQDAAGAAVARAGAGRSVKFEIWDTAGQERYRSLAPIYFRNSAAAVIVYDMTQSPDASFEKAKSWVQTLQRQADAGIIIILVGNKLDIVEADPSSRRVSREIAETYAKEEGLLFLEASAKTGKGVDDLFLEVARKLPLITPPSANKPAGVKLASSGADRVGQACSC